MIFQTFLLSVKTYTSHVILGAILLSWEAWLGSTKKVLANSTLALLRQIAIFILSFILGRLTKGKVNFMEEKSVVAPLMEKVIPIGEIGKLDIDFSAGIAKVSIEAKAPGDVGISGGAFVVCDAEMLINKLFVAIESKLPDNVDPIAETVKMIIVQAVKSIK